MENGMLLTRKKKKEWNEREREREREKGRLFFLLVFKCDVLCRRRPRWMDGPAKQLPLGG
jgi:hypothetical protein